MPQPKRMNSSTYWPANLSNVNKLIYETAIKNFDKSKHANPRVKIDEPSARRLFFFLYLSMSRISEALPPGKKEPARFWQAPRIKIINAIVKGERKDFVKVTKTNLKHFQSPVTYLNPNEPEAYDKLGRRKKRKLDLSATRNEIITQNFIISDEYERSMWQTVIGRDIYELGGDEQIIDFQSQDRQLLSPEEYERHKFTRDMAPALTKYFERHYKITMLDKDGNRHADQGCPAHLLRHLRCYQLLCKLHLPKEIVRGLGGWSITSNMALYYAYTKRELADSEQFEQLREWIKIAEPKTVSFRETSYLPVEMPEHT